MAPYSIGKSSEVMSSWACSLESKRRSQEEESCKEEEEEEENIGVPPTALE